MEEEQKHDVSASRQLFAIARRAASMQTLFKQEKRIYHSIMNDEYYSERERLNGGDMRQIYKQTPNQFSTPLRWVRIATLPFFLPCCRLVQRSTEAYLAGRALWWRRDGGPRSVRRPRRGANDFGKQARGRVDSEECTAQRKSPIICKERSVVSNNIGRCWTQICPCIQHDSTVHC